MQHVADGRGKESLATYYRCFSETELASVETVAMDMSGAFLAATREAVPETDAKIAFDKFRVAMHLGQAVDQVRRKEDRALRRQGDETISRTRHLWLYHPDNLPEKHEIHFQRLVAKALKTSRAWALKELAMEMWESRDGAAARNIFQAWCSWAIRSRLAR